MKEKKILIIIIAVGLLIRIFPVSGLTSGSISYNAGLTLVGSSDPFCGSLDAVGPDQAPLRYIILHFFLFFGRDEFIIRLPSLLFGIMSLLLIYQLGKALFGVKAGLLGSFLLATSLWHIHHSLYIANYTLYAFISLLTVFFFYRWIKDRTMICLVTFIFASVAGFYTFYPFIVLFLTLYFWFLLSCKKDKKEISTLFVSLCIVLILISPALVNAYKGFLWKSNFGDYHWGWQPDQALRSLSSLFGGIRGFVPVNIFIFLIGFSSALFRKKEREKGLFLFLLVVFPCIFFLICSFLEMNVVGRYFLFVYPFFLILSSYGILNIKNKILIALCILLFNGSLFFFVFDKCGFSVARYIPVDYLRHYSDFRFLAGYISDNYKEGDIVVIEQGPGILATQYYLDKDNRHPVKIIKPFCKALPYYRYDADKIKNIFGLVEHDQTPKRLKKLWQDYERLWLIDLNHIHHADRYGKIQQWIDNNYSEKIKFYGGVIYLFDDEFKKDRLKRETYICTDRVCYLDCKAEEVKEIRYPFQGK